VETVPKPGALAKPLDPKAGEGPELKAGEGPVIPKAGEGPALKAGEGPVFDVVR
jgi:hypothetical protein